MTETVDAEARESAPDRVYTWTIRALYAIGISLNVWIVWAAYKDTPEGKALLEESRRALDRWWAPIDARLHFRREANKIHWDAMVFGGEVPGEGVSP